MILGHSLVKSLSSVILTVDQWLASHIILAFNLGRVVRDVIAASASHVDTTTLNSLDQNTLIDVEFEDAIDVHFVLFEHQVKFLSLSGGPGETVKKDASLAFGVFQVVCNQANDELIWNQLAGFHQALCFLSELRACGNSVTEHVAGGQVA